MSKLYKICCHPALLQVTLNPDRMNPNDHKESEIQKVRDDLEFAKVALTPDVLLQMPGGSCIHQPGINDNEGTNDGEGEKDLSVLSQHTH